MTDDPSAPAPGPPPPAGPPAGWYPDPTTGYGFRWWDGSTWTDHVSETAGPAIGGPANTGALSPVGDWMSETIRLVASRAGHLFPMIVISLVPTGLFNGLSLWYGFRQAVITTNTTTTGDVGFANPGAGAGTYVLIAASSVLVLLATVFLTVWTIRQVRAALDDEPETWSASVLATPGRLVRALGVVVALLGCLFALYFLMIVSAAISPVLLVIAFPAWIIGSFLLCTRLALGHVAATVAPSGVRSLATSWELTRGRFGAIFGRLTLLVLISMALSLMAGLLATPFTALAGGGSEATFEPGAEQFRFGDFLGDNPAVFAIGQLFSAIGNGVATVLWATGLILIYRELNGPMEVIDGSDVEDDTP